MCSDPLRPVRRFRPGLALGLSLVLLPLAACGKKGDPMPPPRTMPQAITDLAVSQRGFEVVLEMTHPRTTVSGLALSPLTEATVYEARRPAPEEGAPPPIDPRELVALARPVATLAGPELSGAISGDRLTARLRLEEPLAATKEARYYAVRTVATAGEASPWSNVVVLVPRQPPAPPESLRVTARKEGIDLAWSLAAGAEAPIGFHVYRRNAQTTGWGQPISTLPADAAGHLDATARYGERYIYTVRAIASAQPLIESAPAGEREIDYQDRFAPAPPANLRALGGDGEARLLWEASADADVAGYVVFREDPGQEFRRVTAEPVAGTEFVDRGLGSKFLFRYKVAAIDRSGNLGEPSAVVEARVR